MNTDETDVGGIDISEEIMDCTSTEMRLSVSIGTGRVGVATKSELRPK